MSTIPYHIIRERIFFEEESRLLRVYTSPATPTKVLVPESQAERILSNETNLLKPEDVFAALLALPEQRILSSVVLLDERDEIGRPATHPTWPAAHKSYSYGGSAQVCFHGVSKSDDPVAILSYHWAKEQFIRWYSWDCTFPAAFRRAMWIELNRHIYNPWDIEIDWAVHMAGDILAKETEKFERFAACAPLRTITLCRGLRLTVDVEGNPPLADWLARCAEAAETRVKVAARQQLVEIANTSTNEWRRDDAICLLLHYGEPGDFRSLAGTRLRLTADKVPAEMLAMLAYMDFLEELDLSHLETDWYSACYKLSKCPRLKKLKLKRSRIFSGALSTLNYFKSLTDLDLAETLINDVAVPSLTAKKGLKRLDIRGTEISEEGIASLRRELPSCEIITGS